MSEHEDVNNGLQRSTKLKLPARRSFRRWIEVVLMVTGIVLLAVFAAARLDRFLTSRALLEALPSVRSSTFSAPPASELPGDVPTGSGSGAAPSDENNRAIAASEAASMAGMPLAILRIPRIHLEVPVLDGTDVLTLNHAAGRIAGTARPGQAGNIGIAAHRDSFFRNLGRLHVGDPIELETPSGIQTYVVEQTQVVTPNNLSVLATRPEPSLTLVTCYPFHYLGRAPQRYIVTASLEQKDLDPSSAKPRVRPGCLLEAVARGD